jgi:hypothetical protein
MFKKERNPKRDQRGNKNSFFGKQHTEETKKKMSIKKSKTYKYINPKGKIIEVFNRRKFCIENNLCERSFIRLAKGEQIEYKGYKLAF